MSARAPATRKGTGRGGGGGGGGGGRPTTRSGQQGRRALALASSTAGNANVSEEEASKSTSEAKLTVTGATKKTRSAASRRPKDEPLPLAAVANTRKQKGSSQAEATSKTKRGGARAKGAAAATSKDVVLPDDAREKPKARETRAARQKKQTEVAEVEKMEEPPQTQTTKRRRKRDEDNDEKVGGDKKQPEKPPAKRKKKEESAKPKKGGAEKHMDKTNGVGEKGGGEEEREEKMEAVVAEKGKGKKTKARSKKPATSKKGVGGEAGDGVTLGGGDGGEAMADEPTEGTEDDKEQGNSQEARGEREKEKEKDEVELPPPSKKKKKNETAPAPVVKKEGKAPVFHPSHGREGGTVMVMGQGDVGQLGLGEDALEKKKPFPVGGALEGVGVVQVVCGGMHTVALTATGKVYTWGCNDEGALGRDADEDEGFFPGLVEGGGLGGGVRVVQVSAGDSHTAALTEDGSVYCWGVFRDASGPFGLINSSPSLLPELIYSPTTTNYNRNKTNKAIKIASGNDHLVLLTEQGEVLSLGRGEQGQLGRIPECFSARGGRKGVGFLLRPQVVRFQKVRGESPPKISDVFCGSYHTFAYARNTHSVYAWGLNNYGQLGTGDLQFRFQPERLPLNWLGTGGTPTDVTVSKNFTIAGGQHHTIISSDGCVYVMGRKDYGQLGLGEGVETEPHVPTKVPSLSSSSSSSSHVKVRSVAAGSSCSFCVTEVGVAYSWGMGTNLQLGGEGGGEEDQWTPCKVSGRKMEGRRVIAASSGGQHTALLVTKASFPPSSSSSSPPTTALPSSSN